jgi:hypothetical protein
MLITALEPLALQELQALTGLSPQVATLVTGITAALNVFLSLFKGGKGNTATAASILAALQASVEALQAQTNVDPKALAMTLAILKAIQAGITANANLTTVDPDALQPIQPIA